MSVASERVTFDDFCRVWPLRSDAERVEAEVAFAALSDERRAIAVAGAMVLAGLHEEAGLTPNTAATEIRRGLGGWAELGRMVPEYRELMRRPA